MSRSIKIFWERQLSEFLDSLRNEMTTVVRRESKDYLLNVDEGVYCAPKIGHETVVC